MVRDTPFVLVRKLPDRDITFTIFAHQYAESAAFFVRFPNTFFELLQHDGGMIMYIIPEFMKSEIIMPLAKYSAQFIPENRAIDEMRFFIFHGDARTCYRKEINGIIPSFSSP
jgi:hypothetical protein